MFFVECKFERREEGWQLPSEIKDNDIFTQGNTGVFA